MIFFKKKKKNIHLLHIGKTGGTSIITAFEKFSSLKYNFYTHFGHAHSFKDVPENDMIVFFLRDPLTRFISGFYSRKRKGQPRYNVPWNSEEEVAFNRFETPDDLGTALSSNDAKTKEAAIRAMKGIAHVKTYLQDWLVDVDYLKSRKNDIFFIGFQESFDSDFRGLYKKLTGSQYEDVILREHVNPDVGHKKLSDKARNNLELWFDHDMKLYNYCSQKAKEVNSE